MPGFDEILSATSERVLKRPLSEEERLEILELSSILGMKSVQDYLYMILTFKFHEDRLGKKLDALTEVSGKIDGTLKDATERVLTETAAKIAGDLGKNLSSEALKASGLLQDYHALRGQILLVGVMSLVSAVSFWLGTLQAGQVGFNASRSLLHGLLRLPAGWALAVCSVSYSFLWSLDHWQMLRRSRWHQGILAAQGLLLLAILFVFFR